MFIESHKIPWNNSTMSFNSVLNVESQKILMISISPRGELGKQSLLFKLMSVCCKNLTVHHNRTKQIIESEDEEDGSVSPQASRPTIADDAEESQPDEEEE